MTLALAQCATVNNGNPPVQAVAHNTYGKSDLICSPGLSQIFLIIEV